MNKNTAKATVLATALVEAKDLQGKYNVLDSPKTQNVRNPFPMRVLLQNELAPLPLNQFHVKYPNTSSIRQKVRVRVGKKYVSVIAAIGVADLINQAGKTPDEIISDLESKGYIVNRSTAHQMLSNLKSWGLIDGIPDKTKSYPAGRPPFKYFVKS